MNTPPPCRLGVTGHRRLDAADQRVLRTRLTEVLTSARGPADVRPWLATSLAEGADRLTAEVALELGYELWCPLPMAAADYEKDFAGADSLDEFRRLLARAGRVTTVELPAGAPREAGYTLAGRAVLAACRALLTVWDGLPARGEGGTGQIVAEARARAMPVVWLPSDPPHALQVALAGEPWQPGTPPVLRRAVGETNA